MSDEAGSDDGSTGFAAALVDLDGTVLEGGALLPGAAAGVETLREAGLEVVFLTNNPVRGPADWAAHLSEHGIPASREDVLTSMGSTLAYLREEHPDAGVLPVAGHPVVEQVEAAGFGTTTDPGDADVVLAGYNEGFDYDDLTSGLRAARRGAPVVGTDPDRWVPTDEGPIPGSGAVVNAVAGAAEVEPEAVLGKPHPLTVEVSLERVGVAAERCLLVGDRPDTDIAMGERAGMVTVLVLTGVVDESDLPVEPAPDHVVESLGDVGSVLDTG